MITRSATIVNRLGLHARAAARFVHLAARYQSQVRIGRGSRLVDGKSIMGILLLAAPYGTSLVIEADGPDDLEAIDALSALVASGFGEDAWSA